MRNTKNLKNNIKSLKFRMIVVVILIAIVPAILVSAGILNSYKNRAIAIRTSEVLGQARIITNQIVKSEYMTNEQADTQILMSQIDMLTTIYDGRLMIISDDFKIKYDSYNLDNKKIIISEEVLRSFSNAEITNYDPENHYIEMTIPIIDLDDTEENVLGVMLVSVSTDTIAMNLDYLYEIATIIVLLLSVVIIFFGVLGSIRAMKPFKKMSKSIEEMKIGYGDDVLEINDYTETIQICEQFNAMMSRMKVMDESRQEFVSNVSHELKTPLTSMKVLADSINSMPDAPLELYQEFMGDITNEIERETSIINDLLSLVKMDKTAADLNISSVNINELIEQILKRLQPIADKQQVEVVLESFRPVTAEIDEVKLTLAITNLVENAIKYNKNDGTGWVHVTLNADHQFFYVKVEDSGMGIPEESLEHIYERFYRVDKSHSREIGGTGLGLAITRNSILMHRGAIKAHSVLGEGTTFDVRIPLSYIA